MATHLHEDTARFIELSPPAHYSCGFMNIIHDCIITIPVQTEVLASFPGSPSFRAIIPRMTFDPPEGKAEGRP